MLFAVPAFTAAIAVARSPVLATMHVLLELTWAAVAELRRNLTHTVANTGARRKPA
jgi:hypothetical protein